MSYLWQTHLGNNVPFDPAYHQSGRHEILSFINEPPGLVVDVGCGAGGVGKAIKEKFPQTRVVGIESNARAAEEARKVLDTVICESVDSLDLRQHLGPTRIATLLLLDVLEHLYDPWHTLVRVRDWLDDDSRVIASIPNLRNLASLDELAGGRWTYAPNGVLDITHLRFFTRSSLKSLFEETGYSVLQMTPLTQPGMVDPHVVDRRLGRIVTKHMTIHYRDLDELEELYALQFVIDARRAPEASGNSATE